MSNNSRESARSSKLKAKAAAANGGLPDVAGAVPADPEVLTELNATVTGLTGSPVVVASEEVEEYILNLSRHHASYLPLTEAESELVQTIADCNWQLRAVVGIESSIYALGGEQFSACHAEEEPKQRQGLIQAETFLFYQPQLTRLYQQEERLHRRKEKAIQALELLKKKRPALSLATCASTRVH